MITKKMIIEVLESRCEYKCDGKIGNLSDMEFEEVADIIANLCNKQNVRRSVFVVVHPDAYYYGDRHIEGVFDNKKDAENYIFKKGNADWEIDEHELNSAKYQIK